MSKTKMKCADCGKAFRPNRAAQMYCEECERKRRQQKAQGATAKTPPPVAARPTAGKPDWMAKAGVRDANIPYTSAPTAARPARPTAPASSPAGRPIAAKPPRAPRPPRVPKPPTLPFEPTPEQIAAIEARYLELAQPEFDGIRTQIATELHIPKHAVKEVVQALRARTHLPSWWDMQGYQGAPEDLERIRAAYSRYLPVPPVGIHKSIAQELEMPATLVYRGISTIRQTLGLPHFNPPDAHPELPQPAVAQAARP